jgi:hypothetical protein
MKQLRAASKAYEALAEAFQMMNAPKLRAEAEVGVQMWAEVWSPFDLHMTNADFRRRMETRAWLASS